MINFQCEVAFHCQTYVPKLRYTFAQTVWKSDFISEALFKACLGLQGIQNGTQLFLYNLKEQNGANVLGTKCCASLGNHEV